MKNILLLTSFLVCGAYALPVYVQPLDTNNDPQEYKNIEILLLESAVDQDGGYSFSFENDDGSKVSQEGQHKIVDDDHAVESIRGSYSYNDVNGQPISVTYTADKNGFRPEGAHLPTSPPIPPEILRSLRFLATAKPFGDEELYDYKPKKKVFRGKQYATLNAVQRSRSQLRSHRFSELSANETPRDTLLKSPEVKENTRTETTSVRGSQYNTGNVVQRSRSQLRFAELSSDETTRDALLKSAKEIDNTRTETTSLSGSQYNTGNDVQRSRYQHRFAELSVDETPRDTLLKSVEDDTESETKTSEIAELSVDETPRDTLLKSVEDDTESETTTSEIAELSVDETPRDTLLKSVEDDPKSETTTSETTQKDETRTEMTTSETTPAVPETTSAISSESTDSTESTADIVNEAKKKIQEALKESIEKTSQLAHSATKEAGSAAITAVREEAEILKDVVKLQGTKTQAATQSRGVKKYTDIASDAVWAVDEVIVGLVPPEDDRSWYS